MRIQQAAFAAERPFLKGALHVHTTRSDGQDSPEDVIRLHRQNGYDFMALTDHNVLPEPLSRRPHDHPGRRGAGFRSARPCA